MNHDAKPSRLNIYIDEGGARGILVVTGTGTKVAETESWLRRGMLVIQSLVDYASRHNTYSNIHGRHITVHIFAVGLGSAFHIVLDLGSRDPGIEQTLGYQRLLYVQV